MIACLHFSLELKYEVREITLLNFLKFIITLGVFYLNSNANIGFYKYQVLVFIHINVQKLKIFEASIYK